ncbi:MAG: putative toxin-antitoxin system toxin component, PIN family [Acidimicrobiaceae bacterium]|nr:putative toxin-antitoxin system toxin component, PIN family [Acidimicrobiaceae bacterium]
MKVVLDANIFVSAAIQNGPSHRIIQEWLQGRRLEVVMCPRLLDEITSVLTQRPRIRKWISIADAKVFVENIMTMLDLVPDPTVVDQLLRDDSDDYLIALAQENGAEYIVTGDRDLLDWNPQHLPIISPAGFETILAAIQR